MSAVLLKMIDRLFGLPAAYLADVAPDPIHESISLLPIVLVLAVVVLAVLLVKKLFKKS